MSSVALSSERQLRTEPAPDATGSPDGAPTAELERSIEALAGCLVADPAVVSVVLLGSTARGEAAVAAVDGRIEMFSDLEFLALTAGRLPATRRERLAAEVDQLAAGFGYRSRLFHADVLFRERRRLGSLPPFIFTYELAANGRTVAGETILDELRPVSLVNLDRRNTHEILMKRLWALAEALPAALVRGEALDAFGERELGVVLHRQPLDVTTALLPGVGTLLPTYEQRVANWIDHSELPFRPALDGAIGRDSGLFLRECLARRRLAAPAPDATRTHGEVTSLIVAGLGWLLGETLQSDVPAQAVPAALATRSRAIFNEAPVTPGEWLSLARQTGGIARRAGPGPAIRWALAPRKGLLAAGLIHLHRSLTAYRFGDPEQADAELVRALTIVGVADLAEIAIPRGPLPARWLAARARLGRIFWRTVRLGQPAAWQRLARALDWPAEG